MMAGMVPTRARNPDRDVYGVVDETRAGLRDTGNEVRVFMPDVRVTGLVVGVFLRHDPDDPRQCGEPVPQPPERVFARLIHRPAAGIGVEARTSDSE
jgi:hypothetical protein